MTDEFQTSSGPGTRTCSGPGPASDLCSSVPVFQTLLPEGPHTSPRVLIRPRPARLLRSWWERPPGSPLPPWSHHPCPVWPRDHSPRPHPRPPPVRPRVRPPLPPRHPLWDRGGRASAARSAATREPGAGQVAPPSPGTQTVSWTRRRGWRDRLGWRSKWRQSWWTTSRGTFQDAAVTVDPNPGGGRGRTCLLGSVPGGRAAGVLLWDAFSSDSKFLLGFHHTPADTSTRMDVSLL